MRSELKEGCKIMMDVVRISLFIWEGVYKTGRYRLKLRGKKDLKTGTWIGHSQTQAQIDI